MWMHYLQTNSSNISYSICSYLPMMWKSPSMLLTLIAVRSPLTVLPSQKQTITLQHRHTINWDWAVPSSVLIKNTIRKQARADQCQAQLWLAMRSAKNHWLSSDKLSSDDKTWSSNKHLLSSANLISAWPCNTGHSSELNCAFLQSYEGQKLSCILYVCFEHCIVL